MNSNYPTGQRPHKVDVKLIIEAADLRYLYQRELGGEVGRGDRRGWAKVKALCPFHNDRRPGTVSVNLISGRYSCFSCNKSVGVVDFLKETRNVGFLEAVELLKEVA